MRRRNRNSNKKERAIMVASSVFVLAALTMTGIYVRNNSQESQDDGYSIDFSVLENEVDEQAEIPEIIISDQEEINFSGLDDALDYAPPMAEADSGDVKIPGLTMEDPAKQEKPKQEDKDQETLEQQALEQQALEQQTLADEAAMAADNAGQQTELSEIAGTQEQIGIQPGDQLIWPVNGNVLIPYSMDRTVYFSTLQQYKYSPGMVVAATEGAPVTSAAAGTVTEVFYDEEIGNAVKVDMGAGYVATYGQLKEISVAQGDTVQEGTLLGSVAAPTKYYSAEGCNAYFALTRNGSPVDPMGALE